MWEVHYDPYDITRVWVRNHHDGGWIQILWTHLRTTPTPFGEQVWDHARQTLARRGQDPATEAEIAQAAEALLDKAERGPNGKPDKKDKKVSGRARAKAASKRPLPTPQPQPTLPGDTWEEDGEDTAHLAEVIPLGVFDAHEEAKKWW